MAKSDWKAPFLKLRDQIRPLFDSGVKLYHGILMAPFHERKDLDEVVQNMEACSRGKTKVAYFETPTVGCKVHAHYFFGDSGGCNVLGHALSGIDDWMRAVPKELLPKFTVPCESAFKPYKDLATWTSLVYYLAWEIDAPYLQAAVEQQARVEEVSSDPWSDWPQPEGCDPRPFLIHQGDTSGQFEKMLLRFSQCEEFRWCPDIIGAYVVGEQISGEFISASLAAIDVLVFMLDQVRGQELAKQNELSSPIKRKSTKPRRVSYDVMMLKGFLKLHHDPRETGEKALIPLTTKQIAEYMQWFNENGEPVQSRASRRMEDIFGPDAMSKYKVAFEGDFDIRGFKKSLEDGSCDIEAIDRSDDEDDSEENDFD